MSGDDGQWEVVPSYLDVLRGVYNVCHYGLYVTNGSESVSATGPHRRSWPFIPLEDVFVVLVLAVLWTLIRRLLTDRVFKPLGWRLSLEPSNVAKLPESAWKLLYYGCVWLLTVYIVVLQGKYRFFQQPFSVWDGWSPEVTVPSDIWWIYAVQSSYYVHGMYAVLYQDLWRKDSAVMLAHHSLTLVLLGMSYTFRCHNIGVLVLVLHDLSDVLLEFSKLNVYLKVRAGRKHVVHDRIASAAFVCFAITWYLMRLHYYPCKVMYAASTGLFVKQVFPAHFLFFLGLLSVLLVMNIYWFGMIVLFAVRVVTGDIQELDDTRDYDVVEKMYSSTASNGHHRTSDEAAVLRPASQDDAAKPENGFQNGWHGGLRERHTQPQPQNGS
ncbi:ceramide synthase 1 [Rhipicephalus microplus]|uniref:ceramide synthase 1 n=1 Tax=Rhipicephalus microplus TaxID=6941 RepID=UPI001886B1C6|nr:ceramide synthase 1-like [Rhipicephalus microplus]